MISVRQVNEIRHGKMLAGNQPELTWGWGRPAGRLRAVRRAGLIAEGACLKSGMRVLEIGCGTGLFTEIFSQTGAQIIAVDISPDLLTLARGRNLPRDRVRFIERRFEDCDEEGPFDAVIGSSVLHHLDIEAALLRIYSLLKPGGLMSFAEPNMLNPQVFFERKFAFLKCFSYVSPDETAFVRGPFRNLLLKTGFDEIKIRPFDWLHPATPEPLIAVVKLAGRITESIPVICEFAGSLHIRCRKSDAKPCSFYRSGVWNRTFCKVANVKK